MRVNTCVCTCVHVSACECVCVPACTESGLQHVFPKLCTWHPHRGLPDGATGSGLWPPLPDPLGPRPVCGVATAPPAQDLSPPLLWVGGGRGQEPQPHAEQSRTSPAYVEARSVRCFRAQNRGQGRNVTHSRWQCHRAQGRETGCWTWRFILRTGVAGKTSIAPGAESGWQGGRGCQKGGGRARVAAPGKRKSGAGSRGRHRQPPRHPPVLRSAAEDPQSLSLRPTRPSSVLLQPGHWKVPFVRFFFFFFFRYSDLGRLAKKEAGASCMLPC